MDRLADQLAFIAELDRLKGVLRQTRVLAGARRENSAEHSWHLALMAVVLAEHANESLDLAHVVQMVLVHDLVEIDAGDTFVYDSAGRQEAQALEQQAAERIFALLPADQGQPLLKLWEEFEARVTPEARFAKAIDRLAPVLLNAASAGAAWREHGVGLEQALTTNRIIADGSAALWEVGRGVLEQAAQRGDLRRD